MKTLHLSIIIIFLIGLISIHSVNGVLVDNTFIGSYVVKDDLALINNQTYYISKLYNSYDSNQTIIFHNVVFVMPTAFTSPPDPSGIVYSLAKFTDGSTEKLGVGVPLAYPLTTLSTHTHPQAAFTRFMNNTFVFLVSHDLEFSSPLKQFKSGIPANNVKCEQGLHLVIKSEDNSPACVKLDAAYMLIKKGWATSESAYPGGDRQFVSGTNSTIIPAHLPRSSGLRIPYYESSRVINYSGFDGVYNKTFPYRGTQNDYVLKPGNTGVMTFKIDAMVSEQQGRDYSMPIPKSLNRTNYAIFYHEITSLKDLSKYPGVTSDGSGSDFSECSIGPAGGRSCMGEQFGVAGPIEAFVTDHPGVDVLFEPPSEILPLSMNTTSQVVTMTITADGNASRGTYLAVLPGTGLDSFLLTVGNQPYHE